MRRYRQILPDALFVAIIMLVAFLLSLAVLEFFNIRTMTPMIFVLGVFLVSLRTQGYFWGIAMSLVSVLAVNWAFTYPYWAFDLMSPECISAAVVMLMVSIMTGALTTKLKKQEKMKAEAEKERMRGNLLRAVSHDLRTPLTSIYGASSTMIENFDSLSRQQLLRLLRDIQADSQWLVRMVENLLSITRIDGGKVRLNKNDTVLEELIDAVLVKFRSHYPSQQVQVSIPEEFVSIPMDNMLIQQVLMNLLENAVFHARGMKNLWLTVTLEENRAVFAVADDGCGIPAERMTGLFTGILDSEAPTDTSRSNMGIGLSVCSTIVKAHGSEMKAKNRKEGGAQFSFALDMEDSRNGK